MEQPSLLTTLSLVEKQSGTDHQASSCPYPTEWMDRDPNIVKLGFKGSCISQTIHVINSRFLPMTSSWGKETFKWFIVQPPPTISTLLDGSFTEIIVNLLSPSTQKSSLSSKAYVFNYLGQSNNPNHRIKHELRSCISRYHNHSISSQKSTILQRSVLLRSKG
jgi:hypothetical protein